MSIDWNSVFDRYSKLPYMRVRSSPQVNYRKMLKKYQGKRKRK